MLPLVAAAGPAMAAAGTAGATAAAGGGGAALLGAGLMGLGSIAGGLLGGGDDGGAAHQAEAELLTQMVNTNRSNRNAYEMNRPYMDAGYNALPYLEFYATGQAPTFDGVAAEQLATLEAEMPRINERLARFERMGLQDAPAAQRLIQQRQSYERLVNQRDAANNFSATDAFSLVQNNPVYQWKQQQQADAINSAMGARGMWNSSAATNALREGADAVTAQEFDAQYNRLTNQANMGRGATGQMIQGTYQGAQMMNNALANSNVSDYMYANAANEQLANNNALSGLFNAAGSYFGSSYA